MNEIIEHLDKIGHTLGIGGFEGVIGALVLSLAAIVNVVQSFSLLGGTGIRKNSPKFSVTGTSTILWNGVRTPKRRMGGIMDLEPSVQS